MWNISQCNLITVNWRQTANKASTEAKEIQHQLLQENHSLHFSAFVMVLGLVSNFLFYFEDYFLICHVSLCTSCFLYFPPRLFKLSLPSWVLHLLYLCLPSLFASFLLYLVCFYSCLFPQCMPTPSFSFWAGYFLAWPFPEATLLETLQNKWCCSSPLLRPKDPPLPSGIEALWCALCGMQLYPVLEL